MADSANPVFWFATGDHLDGLLHSPALENPTRPQGIQGWFKSGSWKGLQSHGQLGAYLNFLFANSCGTLLKVYITLQSPAMIVSIEIWQATKIKGVAVLPGNVVLFRLKKEEYCSEIPIFRLLCMNNLIWEGRLFEGDALSSKCRLHWF